MELANELRMSKVVQLRAAMARRSFVLPKHLNLMSSDAGNRARSAGLMIVFADPDDAVAQRQQRVPLFGLPSQDEDYGLLVPEMLAE